MNLTITQENVHLLLPSKLSWMANMLAEDKGISIVEAMKMLYSSEVYVLGEEIDKFVKNDLAKLRNKLG